MFKKNLHDKLITDLVASQPSDTSAAQANENLLQESEAVMKKRYDALTMLSVSLVYSSNLLKETAWEHLPIVEIVPYPVSRLSTNISSTSTDSSLHSRSPRFPSEFHQF